jgi:3-hydroxymyristoyl/3-hydroxydecanoyl-(acyl carrier protein) dehydratase
VSPEPLASLLRGLRRKPLLSLDGLASSDAPPHDSADARPRSLTREDVEGLLPHRGSMLLLDAIDMVDTQQSALRARRRIDPADPVLAGHFPGAPVYPGVLLVEMMGQAGLCLVPLLAASSAGVRAARLTHVHHAGFLAPVLPGDDVMILAALLDESLTVTAVGQIYKGSTLCAYAVSEVYLAD